jgi:hypothetical protein
MNVMEAKRRAIIGLQVIVGGTLVVFWGTLVYRMGTGTGGDIICPTNPTYLDTCYDRVCLWFFLGIQAFILLILAGCLYACGQEERIDQVRCRDLCYVIFWLFSFENFALFVLFCTSQPPGV